jgi:hypothetical protein
MHPRVPLLLLAAVLLAACSRPPNTPESGQQRLPFDREPDTSGISPSDSLVPSAARLAGGTTLVVRLRKPMSSASAHPGDSFEAVLDEPVQGDGRNLLSRGAVMTGRVLDAKSSAGGRSPGYLRITLISLNTGSKAFLIDTSSIFAKAGSRDRTGAGTASSTSAPNPSQGVAEVVFATDRRLTFRLAEAVDLQ